MNGRILYFFSKQFISSLSNIDYAIIKGEALSKLAYGEEGCRHTTDIDILTLRENVSTIENLLLEYGFKQKDSSRKSRIFCFSNSHQILPYIKEIDMFEVSIDINFDVFWGEYEGKRIDISKFLSDTLELEIYGCKIKSLTPIKALLQLALHHYKDMNSIFLLATEKTIKLDMYKDVYYLIKNNLDTITLDNLYSICKQVEIIPYVFYILYHVRLLFDDTILNEYIDAFRTSSGEALLNVYGLTEAEKHKWRYSFKKRLVSDNLFELIKSDLTERDMKKIEINRKVFLGNRKS